MQAFEAQGVFKSYGGVRALRGVDFTVEPGTVHALLGENGAGKSTLVKVMTGATQPDAGSLRLGGVDVSFDSTAQAVRRGVAVVSQELSLFPHLSVLANLYPMREPRRGPFIDRRSMRRQAEPILDRLGFTPPIDTLVAELSLAEQQLVEIAKALVADPQVLLLDEPTSALENSATERLLGVLDVLRERDVGVVYVSHLLEEVMQVSDLVTVLRDGSVVVAGEPIASHTVPSLVAAMVGDRAGDRVPDSPRPERTPLAIDPSAVGLRVDDVSLGHKLHHVSLVAKPGEIVGLAGLVGSGPAEFMHVVAGLRRPSSGTVTLPGGRRAPRHYRATIAAGVGYVSGDRRRLGLMLTKPIWENIVQVRTMGLGRDGGLLRHGQLRSRAQQHVVRLRIKVSDLNDPVGSLSGGNQQKVVLAKWLDNDPSVLILDDPTRGVDVGARAEINLLLRQTADDGAVVLLYSTDLEEIVGICDRVIVFYRNAVCAEVSGADLTQHNLLRLMNQGAEPTS
jgi:ribose transport system ATP-binding protein/rhamnose transport system ATP-binding protein